MLVETMIKTVGEINGRKIKYQPGTDILRVSNNRHYLRYALYRPQIKIKFKDLGFFDSLSSY